MTTSAARRVLGLVAPALLGALVASSARGESVSLNGKSPLPLEQGVSAEVLSFSGVGVQSLTAGAAAAALSATSDALIPPTNRPRTGPLGSSAKPFAATPLASHEAKPAMLAVPEPATLVLGLTSTLILGSLSWKRRLVHPRHDGERGA